ncbi:MAG: DNA-protecting protein DprA [Ruminococcaceae bacterium]|nr:DNA-protecting protein DprA [Oscillospiraceae bacterium]
MDLYNIWLSMVIGANPSNGGDIVMGDVSPQLLYENRSAWYDYGFFTARQRERAMEIPLTAAKTVWEKHNERGIMSVNYTDDEYPVCLRNIPQAPVVLFYKGDITLLEEEHRVSVVGSRNPDRDGTKICTDICRALAENGITIISGLAQGMDTIGHIAALENSGKTVAFIGTSLDKYFPASHRRFQEEIAQRGCVVSEYYVGAFTNGTSFLERNRLIAAAGEIVCVMQAKEKSGTLSTAKKAQEYSKELFAVPGSILNPLYDGTNQLIQDGAYPLLRPDDVLIRFGLEEKPKSRRKANKPKLTPIEQQIYDTLGRETKSTNQLFSQTRIPMVQLKALLTKMEMDGVVKSVSPGVYCVK